MRRPWKAGVGQSSLLARTSSQEFEHPNLALNGLCPISQRVLSLFMAKVSIGISNIWFGLVTSYIGTEDPLGMCPLNQ